jgi:hypothetical protein
MITDVKGQIQQMSVSPQGTDGDKAFLSTSKLGELFTIGWQQRLAMAGLVYTLDLGTITGGDSYTALTGNASVDHDQPEIVIAIDSGFLIPIEIDLAVAVNDTDAYDDMTEVLFIADRDATVAAGATATVETALNNLDGASAFSGRCYSIVTSDITDPTCSDILGFKRWEVTQVAAETAGTVESALQTFYKYFQVPKFIAGPGAIIGYVVGTNAPTFMGSVTFAHVPAGWYPTS